MVLPLSQLLRVKEKLLLWFHQLIRDMHRRYSGLSLHTK